MGAFRNSYTDQEKMHMISRRSAQGGFSAFMCANWGLMCNAPSAMGPGSVIADFDGPQENWQIINDSVMGGRSQGQWSIINDDVMGGVSQGSAQAVDDVLLFKGDISLENNGGFSSVSFKPEYHMDELTDFGYSVIQKSGCFGQLATWPNSKLLPTHGLKSIFHFLLFSQVLWAAIYHRLDTRGILKKFKKLVFFYTINKLAIFESRSTGSKLIERRSFLFESKIDLNSTLQR